MQTYRVINSRIEGKINIMLVDDHQIILDGISRIIGSEDDLNLVACATSGEQAIQLVKKVHPDVVLMDYSMEKMDGVETTVALKKKHNHLKVLALSMYSDTTSIRNMLKAGASGYIFKNITQEKLTEAIHKVWKEGQYLDEDTLQIMLNQERNIAEKNDPKKQHLLTRREIEVLKMIAQGSQTPEIAEKLFISPFTVKSHRKNLLSKLNLKNTAGLVRYAIENFEH